jgi:hypothetical protein
MEISAFENALGVIFPNIISRFSEKVGEKSGWQDLMWTKEDILINIQRSLDSRKLIDVIIYSCFYLYRD